MLYKVRPKVYIAGATHRELQLLCLHPSNKFISSQIIAKWKIHIIIQDDLINPIVLDLSNSIGVPPPICKATLHGKPLPTERLEEESLHSRDPPRLPKIKEQGKGMSITSKNIYENKKSRPNIVALYLYIFFSSIVQGGGHVSKIENL